MICSAGQVAVYYVENSATVAHDLVTKLLYLGINCVTYNDVYLQQISAGNLGEQDVAIGISYSGTSKSTVDVMKLAKRKGASTIVLTNYDDVLIGNMRISCCAPATGSSSTAMPFSPGHPRLRW